MGDWFSGGDSNWFSGGSSSSSSSFKKRKEEEAQKRIARKQQQSLYEEGGQDETQKDKTLLDKAGDVAKGVGGFIADVVTDPIKTAEQAVTGVKDVVEGQFVSDVLEQKTKIIEQRNREWSEKFGNASEEDWKNPEFVKQAQAFADDTKKIQDQGMDTANKELRESKKVDTTKTAFAAAETFLNVATAGVGQRFFKETGKALFKKAVKEGGEEAVKKITKEGGENLFRKLATESLRDATVGAAYGVTQTGKTDPNAEFNDYLVNVAFGAGLGAAVPFIGAGIKKGIQKVKGKKAIKIQPDADDVNSVLNNAIDEQSNKYSRGIFTKIKNKIGDTVDPLREAAKIDDAYAKAKGIKRTDLMADDSVEDLLRRSAASKREAEQFIYQKTDTGESLADLVQKYKGDSVEGKEFNNFANSLFALEILEKKKNYQLPAGLSKEQLQSFTKEYRIKNPNWEQDIKTAKKVNDMAIDFAVDGGLMSKSEGDRIKGAYKYAIPLDKVFPDDILRPDITMRNLGSIGKQTFTQRLEQGSDIPFSNSFESYFTRLNKAVGQTNRAKVAKKILERHSEGLIEDSGIVVGLGNKEAREAIKGQIDEINQGTKYLKGKLKISGRQMRSIEREINKLNKEGLDLALGKEITDGVGDFNPSLLPMLKQQKGKTTSSRQFFKAMIEADPKGLKTVRNKIATREPKLAAKIDEIMNYQTEVQANKMAKRDLKEISAQFVDDSTTGKQIISGVIDGQGYKIELPPETANMLMGFDQKKLDAVSRTAGALKKVYETTWTGVLNPVFAGISTIYDAAMSYVNYPGGPLKSLKVFGPDAMIESLKSFSSNSKFQKQLFSGGARPYGGTGASAFIKPTVESVAAKRNIGASLAHTIKNPKDLGSKLDVFGGKLANATRTRVARVAYKDALKSGATTEEAIRHATMIYRTVMPDYDTMSNLTRHINAFVPFFGASTAGTRAFLKAAKRDPAGTMVKTAASFALPATGMAAFSMMQPSGQDFYKDMVDSGREHVIDNNAIVVLPTAKKNKETGEWEGIIKIPLAPEFRAMNRSLWRTVRGMTGGEGPDASHVALSLFDTVTGDLRSSRNPIIDTVKILAGQDPNTGETIVKGNMAGLPKEEQFYESTSGTAKGLAPVLGTSPIQAEKVLGQFSITGQVLKSGDPLGTSIENVEGRFSGAYGERASNAFFDTYKPVKSRRDKASKEVTSLVQAGKINEARRKADEFNESLKGKFSKFEQQFGKPEEYDETWQELLDSLFIKTSRKALSSRKD